MTERKTSLEKPDPKELAASLLSSSELQTERWEKLSPFRVAGWKTYRTDVFRELAFNRLDVTYKKGQFVLFFYGIGKSVSFDSAKEALKYVDEIETQLGG